MQKNLSFGVNDTIEVKGESVGQVLLSFNALGTDGNYRNVKDFNKVGIDIILTRQNSPSNPFVHFTGFLGDYLSIMYENTYQDAINYQNNDGVKVLLDYSMFPFVLKGSDTLTFRIDANLEAFETGATKTNSSIKFETAPTQQKVQGYIPQYDVYPVGAGEEYFNKALGSSIVRSVITFGNVALADVTTGVPLNSDITADGGFNQDITAEMLIAKNKSRLKDMDLSVKGLVQFNSLTPINGVKNKIKFSQGVSKDTKVLVMRLARR